MSDAPLIIGAGYAGLIAAHAWPLANVVEAGPPIDGHKALLRFRSDAVARATGIPFRKVRVRKGIYDGEKFIEPSIQAANIYEQKCFGTGFLRGERSIWNLDPVDRYIAPEDFYDRMLNNVGDRVSFNLPVATLPQNRRPVISTMPMPAMAKIAGIMELAGEEFTRAPISTIRLRLPGADVFQTVYFTDPQTRVYRASITGSLLIIELAGESSQELLLDDIWQVKCAFGISDLEPEEIGASMQKYGKIADIDNAARKAAMFKLTHEHNVYSLGRFATWRNILLDDVVADIASIKGQMQTKSAYDSWKANAS